MLLYHQYIDFVYNQIQDREPTLDHLQNISYTQGNILYESVEKLLSIIHPTEQDIFFDLGSANGKIVSQVFLTSSVKEACGIEIDPALHQEAVLVKEKIHSHLPYLFKEKNLTFLCGSFLEESFDRATIVLINAICFSPKIIQGIELIINQNEKIHTVLCTKPLFHLTSFVFVRTVRVECSWDTSLCYVYSKNKYQ